MNTGEKIIGAGFLGLLLVAAGADSLEVGTVILLIIICLLIMVIGAEKCP